MMTTAVFTTVTSLVHAVSLRGNLTQVRDVPPDTDDSDPTGLAQMQSHDVQFQSWQHPSHLSAQSKHYASESTSASSFSFTGSSPASSPGQGRSAQAADVHFQPPEDILGQLAIQIAQNDPKASELGTFAKVDTYTVGEVKYAVKSNLVGQDGAAEDGSAEALTLHEREMLESLQDVDGIVHLVGKGLIHHDGQTFIAMEHCGETLFDWFEKRRDDLRQPSNIVSITRQLVGVLIALEKHKTIHGDIKAENVMIKMVDGKPVVKFIDVGFALTEQDWDPTNVYHTPFTRNQGSPQYAAPELWQRLVMYNNSVDVWAVGVLLYAMIFGVFPFYGPALDRMIQGKKFPVYHSEVHNLTPDFVQQGTELIQGLLIKDLHARMRFFHKNVAKRSKDGSVEYLHVFLKQTST